jgi:hypothetical protein
LAFLFFGVDAIEEDRSPVKHCRSAAMFRSAVESNGDLQT